MNSAPVQLLPIESGSGYKQKTPDIEQPVDNNGKFEDVFNRTVSQKESPPDERVVGKGKEGAGSREKTDVSETKSESGRKKDQTDVIVREDAAAGKDADAAERLKRGLSSEKGGTKLKRSEKVAAESGKKKTGGQLSAGKTDKSDRLKKIELEIGKLSTDGSLKTAAGSGLNITGQLKQNAEGPDSERRESRLLDKLKTAAESAGKTESAKDGKAGIRLIAVVPGNAAKQADTGLSDAAKTGKPGAKTAGSGKNKFRIVDHRKHNESISISSEKTDKPTVEAAAKNELQGGFKDALGSLQSNSSRIDSSSVQTKQLQSSVLAQLKDSVNSQIVRQAGIVVKGNGTGEIKLVMKPESLGNVRIHLSLNDNHIAGRIIVENNIVREIFESNLENLYKAFGSEGFENGGLEVSVEGQGGNTENGSRKNGRGIGARAARVLGDAVPELVENEWRNNAVNMVV